MIAACVGVWLVAFYQFEAHSIRGIYGVLRWLPFVLYPLTVCQVYSTRERVGYPTQKPEALLERIIESSSRPGDVVLDPFCGSGTTLAVAERLGRRWIGMDSAEAAIEITRTRLGLV